MFDPMYLLIWGTSVIGSTQMQFSQINGAHIIDFVGIFIGLVYSFYQVIIKKQNIQIQHFLNVLSALTTITLIAYSASPDNLFVISMVLIRTLRLLLPFVGGKSIMSLLSSFSQNYQLIKLVLALILAISISSIILNHGPGSQNYNRCRNTI
jgi:hypothetical protein